MAAVITAAELRSRYLPEITGPGEDTYLGTLIDAAEQACARYCGFPAASSTTEPIFTSTTYTLYGPNSDSGVRLSDDGMSLFLDPRPVTAVTSLHEDGDEGYGSAYLISSSDYSVVVWGIRMKPTGSWGALDPELGDRSIKVVFTAGYSTVPESLKFAVASFAKYLYLMRHHSGVSSVSEGGQSSSVEQEIPDHVKTLLAPFVLSSAMG